MPDITMCKGDGCPMKETCYRFTANSDELMLFYHRQSFFINAPIKEDNTCEYYWPNEKQNGTKKLSEKNSKRRAWHY
jgi:hypothetical protein